jgi:RimJ/RimL family protein N-acetyltransferase
MQQGERRAKKDKSGLPYEIGFAGADDFPGLWDMYRFFSPRPASQGLPPADHDVCYAWASNLYRVADNFLAWSGGAVIGHAALLPDLDVTSGELVIFVAQAHRNLGVGTELTRLAVEQAKDLKFRSVWLTVDVMNHIAIKLYKNLGFVFCDMDDCERVMRLTF